MFSKVNSKGIFNSQLLSFLTLSIVQYCLQNTDSQNLICLHSQVERLGGNFSYCRMVCSVWNTRWWTQSKIHVNTMQDLRFSQWCCWRFKSFEIWQCVTLNCLTLKSKTLCYFRKLETTHQTKQHHVLEILNLQVILSFQCFPAASRYSYWIQCAVQMNMYLQRTLITYLLTPWSRVLFEKLTGFAANQEIPRILWYPKVHYHTHKRPPPVPILSQLHPVPTTLSHFLKIHLNIILLSASWSPQWSLSLRFPHQNLEHTSPFLHACHMTRPSHSSRFYHPHNIGWGVQIIKLLFM